MSFQRVNPRTAGLKFEAMMREKSAPRPLKRSALPARTSYLARNTAPKKESDKPLANAIRRLDNIVSRFVRWRDTKDQGGVRWGFCMACGNPNAYGQLDNGHFIGRENYALRWSEINCWACCQTCNRWKEGNKNRYRVRLVAVIGESQVSMLESTRHEPKPKLYAVELLILIWKEKLSKLKGTSDE